MKVNDETFGEMHFKYVWERDFQISFLEKEVTARLSVGTSEDVPCTLVQKSIFIDLKNNIESVNANIVSALFMFYKENIENFREYINEVNWELQAPDIESEIELQNLVSLENINICDTQDNSKRVVYYFSTTFEDELGVSVIIVDGAVIEVVTDVAY